MVFQSDFKASEKYILKYSGKFCFISSWHDNVYKVRKQLESKSGIVCLFIGTIVINKEMERNIFFHEKTNSYIMFSTDEKNEYASSADSEFQQIKNEMAELESKISLLNEKLKQLQ